MIIIWLPLIQNVLCAYLKIPVPPHFLEKNTTECYNFTYNNLFQKNFFPRKSAHKDLRGFKHWRNILIFLWTESPQFKDMEAVCIY